jgi:hypothetical protein
MSGRLDKLISELVAEIDRESTDSWYLETKKGPEGETVLGGNKDGLLILLRDIGRIYQSRSDSSHFHYDSVTTLDECEVELIVRRLLAPWDIA